MKAAEARPSRRAAVVLLGTALLGAVAPTLAALRDSATVRAEVSGQYQLAALDDDGRIRALTSGDAPGTLAFRPASGFVPGGTLTFSVTLAGNTPAVGTVPEVVVTADGALHGQSTGSPLPYLRVSVAQGDGSGDRPVLGDPAHPERGAGFQDGRLVLSGLDPLMPRNGPAQQNGERWNGGPASCTTLRFTVHLLDDPRLADFTGQDLTFRLSFTGRSAA